MRLSNLWLTLFLMILVTASVSACSCGDDDDDDDGAPADDDTGDDDDDDDDDDIDDDADDDADDDVGPECVDEDGDTYGENCDAGPDCNDGDGTVWTIVTGYVDGDGDGFVGTGVDLCTDGTLPAEYLPESEDCDDEDPTVYPGAAEFPDDGIDQDCDDADATADEADGFFVDTAGGDDGDDGTKDAPFATIQKGIDEAAADADKPNVYIAEGTYTEDVTVPGDGVVRLFGGYDPATWTRDVKAPTVLEPDTLTQGLLVFTGASVLIQGMTVHGASSGSAAGIVGNPSTSIDVADSTIEVASGAGEKTGVAMSGGSSFTLHRSTIDVGESSDNSSTGVFVGYSAIAISDSEITSGGAPMDDAVGLYLIYSSGTVAGTTVEVGDADNVIGALLSNSAVSFEESTLNLGDAVSQNYGLYAVTGFAQWFGGSISLGDAPTGSNIAVYMAASSVMMNGATVSTGDADSINAAAYAVGGLPGARAVFTNNVFTTGDTPAANYAMLISTIDAVIGQNTVVAGAGDTTRTALYMTIGGTEMSDPVVYNNHFGSGPSSGDSYAALIPAGAPFRKVVFVGNNLDGGADALVYDGTNSLTDIDDVNACDFDSCRQATGNLNEDPDFAGADDFHPNAGSPLIDAGVNPLPLLPPDLLDSVWYDLDGNPRPAGAGWDIGAYEVE